MYINSGYLHNSLLDFKDKTHPLVVGSCGTYRLIHQPRLPTYRPRGRIDYQLLYITAGKGHFFFDNKEQIIEAGHMILYKPREMQKYVYYGADQTEVYWVHFTGSNVKNILKEYGLFETGRVIQTGNSPEYHQLFQKMIQELQLTRPHYEEYLSILLRELFLLVSRQAPVGTAQNRILQKEMEAATQFFNEHFTENISVEDYALSRHMSICWFIRSFKRYNGVTPMQYSILSISGSQMQKPCSALQPTLSLRWLQLWAMRTLCISVDCSKNRQDFLLLNSGTPAQIFTNKIYRTSLLPKK